MKKSCIAMLLAGGQGSRLYALTQDVAKPSVPFGGKYRIIDFPLSNCANSGIDTVGVLTQYKPLQLNSYIGIGQPWDLDVSDGGPRCKSPAGTSWKAVPPEARQEDWSSFLHRRPSSGPGLMPYPASSTRAR